VPRIIHVARNLDRGNDPAGASRDLVYYLDKGSADNVAKGDVLNVYREVRIGPNSLRIFVGTMAILDAQQNSSMGRFTPSPSIDSQPLVKYKTALKSDMVMPRLALSASVLFDQGQFNLKPGTASEFDKVGAILKGFPSAKILISGHTDADGDAQTNLRLSEQRAEAVRLYLINTFNIEAARIESKGFGEEQPIVPNDTPENKTLNRRIEVSVWE
jgi:outer membrane protein OmpA-like peptidoglycan-associated protein